MFYLKNILRTDDNNDPTNVSVARKKSTLDIQILTYHYKLLNLVTVRIYNIKMFHDDASRLVAVHL